MGTLALKTVSGVAATCALTSGKTLLRVIILWVTVGIWLATLLTVFAPLVAMFVLIFGTDEMIRAWPFSITCWMLSVCGLVFIAWMRDPSNRKGLQWQ